MASTSLILALTVLTATILVLLILWILIRYTKEKRLQRTQHRVHQDAEFARDNGESQVHLAQQEHCRCRPSGVEHEEAPGVKLQRFNNGPEKKNSGEKAENWLKKGASKDDLRGEEEGPVSGKNTAKIWGGEGDAMAWNMSISKTGYDAEGAERVR